MIKTYNVVKKYSSQVAVNGVSFTVNDGECFALLGLNGAGKTTLINVLSTVTTANSGNAVINGFSVNESVNDIRKISNVSPQENAVCKNLTAYENLNLIADIYGVENKQQKIEEMLTLFDLTEKQNVLAKKLSGGQARRLSIALALITSPKVLYLDEPTLGLDVKARSILWQIIKELKGKMTILLTTHYLDEVEHLADRVAIMSKGEIRVIGTIEEIKKQTETASLEEAFLRFTEED